MHTKRLLPVLLAIACGGGGDDPPPEELSEAVQDLQRYCEDVGQFATDACGAGQCDGGEAGLWQEAIRASLMASWELSASELDARVDVTSVEEISAGSWELVWTERRDWVTRESQILAEVQSPPATVEEAMVAIGSLSAPLPDGSPRSPAAVDGFVRSCGKQHGVRFDDALGWCTVYTNDGPAPQIRVLAALPEDPNVEVEAVAHLWPGAEDRCEVTDWSSTTAR